jgi:hypothetical protein
VASGHIILVTDEKPLAGILEQYTALLGDAWKIHHIPLPVRDGHTNYKEEAQLTIATMRTAAFTKARALGVEYVWSLDSDVLPPVNGLKCMLQMLAFDDNYYGVATCPYPSQGGGGFLFGRGTIQRQIAEDVSEDERTLPPELVAALADHRAKQPQPPDEAWITEMRRLEEEVKKCPPKGNVFELNAKGWRKRGWGEMAYPAIGKGSVVPTDWCGFGNTLMSKKALNLATFTGYEGKGTEDLWICWQCWYPHGIQIVALPHCLSHHVVRNKQKPGAYTLCYAYHETEGECVGHIRLRHIPWQEF